MSDQRDGDRDTSEPPGRGWRGSSSGRGDHPEQEPPPVIRDKRKFDAEGNLRMPGAPEASWGAASGPASRGGSDGSAAAEPGLAAAADPLRQGDVDVAIEVLDLQTQLDERTADLQRLSAEFANYRKRVDRDRLAMGERASARVVEAMLPVLDDIERAGAHGDLSGAFKAVADKLAVALSQFGLQPFGTAGEPFDPAIHEAVMHDENDTVEVATASSVMRQGYRLGERLLRPAMVGVTDPIERNRPPVENDPVEP